jgi:hypothetical protein
MKGSDELERREYDPKLDGILMNEDGEVTELFLAVLTEVIISHFLPSSLTSGDQQFSILPLFLLALHCSHLLLIFFFFLRSVSSIHSFPIQKKTLFRIKLISTRDFSSLRY